MDLRESAESDAHDSVKCDKERAAMSILADQHIHSHHSGDSDESMERIADSAIAAGLKYLCFTEHMDFGFPYEKYADSIPPGTFDLDVHSYYEE